jgi:hypothetical protein
MFGVPIWQRINLGEIGLEDVDWMHLAKNREQWRTLVNMTFNLRIP